MSVPLLKQELKKKKKKWHNLYDGIILYFIQEIIFHSYFHRYGQVFLHSTLACRIAGQTNF